MSVVHGDQDGPFGREVRAQPVQTMQTAETEVGNRPRRAFGPQLEEWLGEPRGPGQDGASVVATGLSKRGFEELAHDAEPKATFELTATGGEHPEPAGGHE